MNNNNEQENPKVFCDNASNNPPKNSSKHNKLIVIISVFVVLVITASSLTVHFLRTDKNLLSAKEETTEESTTQASKTTETTTQTKEAIAPVETTTNIPETTIVDENENPYENPTVITIDENNKYMTLVNTKYRIPDDYDPELVYVCGSDDRLEKTVAEAYEKMYNAAAEEGIYLTPCSGYRSYDLQKRNYNNLTAAYENQGYTHREALIEAAKEIMPPGSSEHNLGFAMDILCIEEWFEDTKQFKWLSENAQDYGFIMRYAKDKQDITGVIYEPWHWRYVGVEEAKKIKASGLCLEEYLGDA